MTEVYIVVNLYHPRAWKRFRALPGSVGLGGDIQVGLFAEGAKSYVKRVTVGSEAGRNPYSDEDLFTLLGVAPTLVLKYNIRAWFPSFLVLRGSGPSRAPSRGARSPTRPPHGVRSGAGRAPRLRAPRRGSCAAAAARHRPPSPRVAPRAVPRGGGRARRGPSAAAPS